ncbi:hypothetical protein [Streptacidiphilus sp. MAP5-3]|uniref:glycine-rich domain-containing protein n=1 Tax=unclassified Streptacidiphilus TaxID=2643834 RepID=UPI0035188675
MTTLETRRTGRELVKPILFDKLAARIVKDHPEHADIAERITEQALAFLGTAATATQPIGPSALVDIGWHTFILHTRDYARFCDRIAGRFIHHEPNEPREVGAPLSATVDVMRASGYLIDADLWGVGGKECTSNCCQQDRCQAPDARMADCQSRCTQCHQGCTDSPSH